MGKDNNKTKQQLIEELKSLRKKIAELEDSINSSAIERRKTEEALLENAAKHKFLFDSTSDWMYLIDRQNVILSLNIAAATIFHKEPSEVIGKSLFDLFPKDIAMQYAKNLEKVFKTGKPRSSETIIVAGGRKSFISVQLNPVRNPQKKITAVIGITRDITRRKEIEDELAMHRERLEELVKQRTTELIDTNEKLNLEVKKYIQAEKALRDSEQRFSQFMDHLPAVAFIKDEKSKALYVNKYMRDVLGAKEWLNRPLEEIVPKDLAKKMIDDDQKVLSDGYRHLTEIVPDVNNKELTFQTHKFRIDRKDNSPLLGGIAIDITEQKQAEREILQWKNRYESAIAASGHVLFDWNSETNEVTFGGAIKDILGFNPNEMAGGLTRWIEFIHPEDRAYFKSAIQHLIATKKSASLEYRIQRKDGEYIYIESTGQFVEEEQSKITRMIGFIKDITERKQSEERIRLLSTAIEQSTEGIALADLEGNVVYVNEAYAKVHSYKPQDLIGKHISKLHSPDQMKIVGKAYKLLQEAGKFSDEIWHTHKNGTRIMTLMTSSHVRDESGKPIAMITTLRDITEQKRSEEALRQSEEKYRLLVENATEAIAAVDKNGRFLVVNTAAARIMGGKPADFISKTLWDILPREVADERMKSAEKVMKSGRGYVHKIEIPIKGETLWFQQSTQPIRDSSGQINGILSISSNITENIRAEDELRTYRKDLERLIKERTVELENKNKELERMNKLFVGREFRIKELRDTIKELEKEKSKKEE